MEKTSKVVSVQANGSWTGNYGEMFKFELAFENGDTGEYSSKSADQQKFIQGNEATYTIDTSNPKYPKIKPVFVQISGGFKGGYNKENPERQRMIVKQSSLKVALDFMIAKNPKTLYVDDVINVADKMVDWVMEKPQNGAALEKQAKHTEMEYEEDIQTKQENLPF